MQLLLPSIEYHVRKFNSKNDLTYSCKLHNVIVNAGLSDLVEQFLNLRKFNVLVVGEGVKDEADNVIPPDENTTQIRSEVGRKLPATTVREVNTDFIVHRYEFGVSELICPHPEHPQFQKTGELVEVGLARINNPGQDLGGNLSPLLSVVNFKDAFGNPTIISKTQEDSLIITTKIRLITQQVLEGVGSQIALLPLSEVRQVSVGGEDLAEILVTMEVRDSSGNRVSQGADSAVSFNVTLGPVGTTSNIFDPDIQGLVQQLDGSEIGVDKIRSAKLTTFEGRVTFGIRSIPNDRVTVTTSLIGGTIPSFSNWNIPEIFTIQLVVT